MRAVRIPVGPWVEIIGLKDFDLPFSSIAAVFNSPHAWSDGVLESSYRSLPPMLGIDISL